MAFAVPVADAGHFSDPVSGEAEPAAWVGIPNRPLAPRPLVFPAALVTDSAGALRMAGALRRAPPAAGGTAADGTTSDREEISSFCVLISYSTGDRCCGTPSTLMRRLTGAAGSTDAVDEPALLIDAAATAAAAREDDEAVAEEPPVARICNPRTCAQLALGMSIIRRRRRSGRRSRRRAGRSGRSRLHVPAADHGETDRIRWRGVREGGEGC